MSRSFLSPIAWQTGALIGLFLCHHAAAQTKPTQIRSDEKTTVIEVTNHLAPSEAKVRKSLGTLVEADFREAPLNEVIQSIAKKIGNNIFVDEQALREQGLLPNEVVSHHGKPLAAARLLDRILPPLGLTWIVQDHVVKVTTIIAAQEIFVTRTYPVGDLIDFGKTHRTDVAIVDSSQLQFVQFGGGGNEICPCGPIPDNSPEGWLLELVQRNTLGDLWDSFEGSQGTLSYINNTIVIRQTQKVQDQCARILQTVRQFTKEGLPEGVMEIRPPHYSIKEDAAVKKALTKVLSIHCQRMPLNKVMEKLSDQLSVPIHLDEYALKEEGVALDETLSLELNDLPARSLLKLALLPLGCCMLVEDGRILVTTILAESEHVFTKFYDIRDLIEAGYESSKLPDLLQQETSGDWLHIANFGHGPMIPLDGLLAIQQTPSVFDQIDELLTDLRKNIAINRVPPKRQLQLDPKEVTTQFYNLNGVGDPVEVREAIAKLIAPDSWAINTGDSAGQLHPIGDVLVVKNRNEVQVQIKAFLDDLKKARANHFSSSVLHVNHDLLVARLTRRIELTAD